MHDQFMILDSYLTDEECDSLVRLFDDTPLKENQSNNIWANRVKWPKYPDDLRTKIGKERRELVEKFYSRKLKIDNLNITLWNTGDFMPPHSDYGGQNEFPWREYASLIYLNDDYDGGELYIPEWSITYRPKKGQLVAFPGGKVRHGVREITRGRRLTSICWFKNDSI